MVGAVLVVMMVVFGGQVFQKASVDKHQNLQQEKSGQQCQVEHQLGQGRKEFCNGLGGRNQSVEHHRLGYWCGGGEGGGKKGLYKRQCLEHALLQE